MLRGMSQVQQLQWGISKGRVQVQLPNEGIQVQPPDIRSLVLGGSMTKKDHIRVTKVVKGLRKTVGPWEWDPE